MRKLNLTLVAVILAATFIMGAYKPNSGEGIKNDIILNADNMIGNYESLLIERIELVSKMSEKSLLIDKLLDRTLFDEWKRQYIEVVSFAEEVFSELIAIEAQDVVATEDNSINGTKAYYTLTSYTSGKESTGKTSSHPEYGITASGAHVKEGVTIACPKSMKFGTEVYIPSLDNTYTCQDRGGAIKNKIIDVYIENLSEALEFGRKKNVEIYILDEV